MKPGASHSTHRPWKHCKVIALLTVRALEHSQHGGLVVAHQLLFIRESDATHISCISGLVAEYIVAIDVTRVQFPADASLVPVVLSWCCGSVLVFFKLPSQD